jgi:hypothetical protein
VQRALLDLETVNVALRELEDSFTLAPIAQVPGKRRWCLCVGAVSALVKYVVDKRRRVVGFITVKVDDAVRCLLCCVCWEDLYYFMSPCDRHGISSSSFKLQLRCRQVAHSRICGLPSGTLCRLGGMYLTCLAVSV